MKTITNEETKGIVFAGCSFTWGQGLYYYSNLATLQEPGMFRYDDKIVTAAHKRYMAAFRYPRLVANHFNTFEIVSNQNSGSETQSFDFLKKVFGIISETKFSDLFNERIFFKEIEYIVFQTSQSCRNVYYYEFEGGTYGYCIHDETSYDTFYKYLSKNNISVDDAMLDLANIMFKQLKDTLQFYERCGIKTLLIHWENDYMNQTLTDRWMNDRLVTFDYNEKNYKSIYDLMVENRHLDISEDYTKFIVTPEDGHPSLECHRVIADSVIKKIEETKNKKYDSKLL